jgi:hypothetical protein
MYLIQAFARFQEVVAFRWFVVILTGRLGGLAGLDMIGTRISAREHVRSLEMFCQHMIKRNVVEVDTPGVILC